MTLIEEAGQIALENVEKLRDINNLYDQAFQLLVTHGEDSHKPNFLMNFLMSVNSELMPYKNIRGLINNTEVQIFSSGLQDYTPPVSPFDFSVYKKGGLYFIGPDSEIILAIPDRKASFILKGNKSRIKDNIKHPDSLKSLTDITQEDILEWGSIIQDVTYSFRI